MEQKANCSLASTYSITFKSKGPKETYEELKKNKDLSTPTLGKAEGKAGS